MLIDSHAHLTFEGLDLPAIMARAQEVGVEHIVNICTNPEELERGIALAKEYSWISNVASTTPHDVEKDGEAHFNAIAAQTEHLVAIGETGLDYYYTHSKREVQQHFLRRYFDLATKVKLPVVIHCRDAFDDFFNILDECYQGEGVLHCFTGTEKEAEGVIERGWYLSLSGIVTFKKSYVLHEVAKKVPLEKLLVETDTPYLAPVPYRGKQNEPAYVVETAKFIAQLRGISFEELAHTTKENAKRLFSIK